MIKVGDKLPEGKLQEFIEVEGNGCSVGPNTFDVPELAKAKTIAIFGLPGAFTPTCSAKHVPSYLSNYDALRAKGIDEIWCIAVNDPFVMGAWARQEKATGNNGAYTCPNRDVDRLLFLHGEFDRAKFDCRGVLGIAEAAVNQPKHAGSDQSNCNDLYTVHLIFSP